MVSSNYQAIKQANIAILGGGLAGLALAAELIDDNIACAFKCDNRPSRFSSNALHALALQHLNMAASVYFS